MNKRARRLIGAAGLVLIFTAALHGSGTAGVSTAIAESSASDFLKETVPGLWLFFSWHLVAIGLGALVAAMNGNREMRPLVWFITGVSLVDMLWLLRVAGLFVGTGLLALAALLLVAGVAQREP